jgi:hypothetical protein
MTPRPASGGAIQRPRRRGGPLAVALAMGGFLVLAMMLRPATVAAADPADPDLRGVAIDLGDLPAGFIVSEDAASSFFSLAHSLATSLDSSPTAADVNPVVYERRQGDEVEFVVALLVSPMSPADQLVVDTALRDPTAMDQLADQVGTVDVTRLDGPRIGEQRLAARVVVADPGVTEDFVMARRGPVLEFVGHLWVDGTTPRTSLSELGRLLDARLARVTGVAPPSYREPGLLVPELTTHIPTPLDVSTDPAVVGTNLLLAALATILLTISSKLATRMLAEHESSLARRLPLVERLGRLEARAGSLAREHVSSAKVRDASRLAAIAVFYGLVFSLLEPGWQPLTVTGLWLLVSFTIACGIVGIADDLVQWRIARRWGLPAELGVRPSNALLAIASTGISRVAVVVPGLMFGAPEALRLEASALDPARERRLTLAGFLALVAIGGGSWLATVATTAAAGREGAAPLLDGTSALLLLVFAATVQNLFVALLGLSGTAGGIVRRWHPVAWVGALLAVTFVFWHTLVNPTGDAALALTTRNVQVAVGLVGAFTVVVVATWAIVGIGRRREAPAAGPMPPAVAGPVAPAPLAAAGPPVSPAPVEPVEPVMPVMPTAPAEPPVPVVPAAWVVPAVPSTDGGSAAPPLPPAAPMAAAPAAPVAVAPALPVSVAPAAPIAGSPSWDAPQPAGVVEVSLATIDASARGRARFRVAGGTVTSVTTLIDPRAARQLGAFATLSLLAIGAAALAYLFAVRGGPPDIPRVGFGALVLAWVVGIVIGRIWLERYRVVHTVSFGGMSIAGVDVSRDWGLGCLLSIILSPLLGLLYLALAGRRIITVTAPLAADRPGLVRLRLKGSEAEGRLLAQLLLGARAAR